MRMPEALASFEGVDQALDLRFLDSGEDNWGWTPQSSATAAASRSSMGAATMLGLERCRGGPKFCACHIRTAWVGLNRRLGAFLRGVTTASSNCCPGLSTTR